MTKHLSRIVVRYRIRLREVIRRPIRLLEIFGRFLLKKGDRPFFLTYQIDSFVSIKRLSFIWKIIVFAVFFPYD